MALAARLQPQQLWGELEMEAHTGCTPEDSGLETSQQDAECPLDHPQAAPAPS